MANSTDTFRNEFSQLNKGSNPIIFVKTREPEEVLDSVKLVTQNENDKFVKNNPKSTAPFTLFYWNCFEPVKVYTNENLVAGTEPTQFRAEGVPADDPLPLAFALHLVYGMDHVFKEGIYLFDWAHYFLDNKAADSVTIIRHAALKLCKLTKKLVFIVPETFELPVELNDYANVIELKVPTQDELLTLTKSAYSHPSIKSHIKSNKLIEDASISLIPSAGAGMTKNEFINNLNRVLIRLILDNKAACKKGDTPFGNEEIAAQLLVFKTEMVKRSDILEVVEAVDINNIGGLDLLKEWVTKRKDCFSDRAIAYGVDRPKGIALIGPPGTGKSASAKAIGSILNLSVIRFDVSRVFNQFVGSSEQRVRSALNLIEAISPCVVFVDEIDKMFDINGGGDSGVSKRVLGAILTFLQESKSNVFWVMTANRTHGLPPELLRKGRLDEIFSVTMPNKVERSEVLKIHLKKRKQDPSINLDKSIAASAGYVSAELEAAVKDAVIEAFTRGVEVDDELIAEQFSLMQPQSLSFKAEFEAMDLWSTQNARPASLKDESEDAGLVRKNTNGVHCVTVDID